LQLFDALQNVHRNETFGGWQIKLNVKHVDPEVDILSVGQYSQREYTPDFGCNHHVLVKARFRYQAEYQLKDSLGKLKYGGNLTRGDSTEVKDLVFSRKLSQSLFQDSVTADDFRNSSWKLVSVQ